MGSLIKCLKKHGKEFTSDERAELKAFVGETGSAEKAMLYVNDLAEGIDSEIADIISQAEKQGFRAKVPKIEKPIEEPVKIVEEPIKLVEEKPVEVEPEAEIEVTGKKDKTVSVADTLKDTIKGQKGSVNLESPTGQDLIQASRNIYLQGHTRYSDFKAELQRIFANVWEKIKKLVRKLYRAAKAPLISERGGVTLERKAPKKAAVPPTPPQAPIEKDTGFDEEKDIWIGNKDEQVLRNNAEAINLQDSIKEALGKKKYDKEAQDMDKAIHRYLDLKRNPKHLKEFYDEIPKEQQRIVDIVKTIDQNPKLKQIAETIRESYKQIGRIALDEGVIFNVLDNYVSRVWKVRKT